MARLLGLKEVEGNGFLGVSSAEKNIARFCFSNIRLFFLIFLTLFLSLVVSVESFPSDDPWPMSQHDARHTGQSSYIGPQEPDVSWSLDLSSSTWAAPAIDADNNIYLSSTQSLHVIDSNGNQMSIFAAEDSYFRPAKDQILQRKNCSSGNIILVMSIPGKRHK